MNPLILSLICLVLVGVSANLISLIKKSKIFLILSLIPCVYILVYGIYVTLGPIDLYEDGTRNFFIQNPKEKDLPVIFVFLKFYQFLLYLSLNNMLPLDWTENLKLSILFFLL